MDTMDMASIIDTVRASPNCTVHPPAGLPNINEEHILPDATEGPWQIIGHSSKLLEAATIPEIRVVGWLQRGDTVVRLLSPEEDKHYPEFRLQANTTVEHALREHFADR